MLNPCVVGGEPSEEKMKRFLKPIGLILAMIALQGATCDPRQSNAGLLKYKLVKDETTIDPVTGETVMTSTWEYEGGGGYRTTTTKRLPKGNEQRQWDRPPRPDPIVVD